LNNGEKGHGLAGMDFANLRHNYETLMERIEKACRKSDRKPTDVTLVAITKTHPVEIVQAVVDLGIKNIGENRVQEIERKAPFVGGDFSLHMVGHLQTNKVGKVLPFVDWIQSIDSMRLAEKIDAVGAPKKIKALVEVNTSGEPTKSGCAPGDCFSIAQRISESGVLDFKGLMTIGPLGGDESAVRKSFESLRKLGEACRGFSSTMEFSMGMSADFEWAIEEGATIIRVGSLLFGNREK
jgi:pyridoxal phosphate enzyme (YggS family)